MIPQFDEIGNLDTPAQFGCAFKGRHQKTRGPFQGRVGQAQAGQVENRHAGHLQHGIIEIQLAFLLVMDDPPRPDLPQWHRVVGTNLTTGRHGFVKLGIAPVDTVDFCGGQLHLLAQNHPRAAQDTVAHIPVHLRAVGQHQNIRPVNQGDRPFNLQAAIRAGIDDAAGLDTGFPIEDLHMPFGG